jgi:hypothetical protein
VDTTIECGHVKRRVLTSRDYWAQIPADLKPRRTFAVVPVKDQFAYTTSIVFQLRKQAVDAIVVVDNGSGKKTRNWLESQDDIVLLDAPDAGIHEMWNMGAAFALTASPAGCDVAFLNNDLNLGEGCIAQLSHALRENGDLAVVCPNYDGRVIAGDGGGYISLDGENRAGDFDSLEYRSDICANRYDGTGGIAGFAFMVRGELFHRYRFPEDCKWWFGDNDLLLTVQAMGLRSAIVLDASCEHLDGGGKTGSWDTPEMQAQLKADQDAFVAKWDAKVVGGDVSGAPPTDSPIPAPSGPIE